MPNLIPFIVGDNNYRLAVPLDDTTYLFDVRWNSRDAAWYMDILTEAEVPIGSGLKLVLGAPIGKHNPNLFFREHTFTVIDTSGENRDAGYDDLGARVVVIHMLNSTIGQVDGD